MNVTVQEVGLTVCKKSTYKPSIISAHYLANCSLVRKKIFTQRRVKKGKKENRGGLLGLEQAKLVDVIHHGNG